MTYKRPSRGAYVPHDRVRIKCKGGRTQQSMGPACDINNIMRSFERDGMTNHVNQHQGHYGDYTEVQNYQTSLNQVIAAQAAFETLPAQIRKRFDNDPAQFLEFVDDENNQEEMRSMGLLPSLKAPVGAMPQKDGKSPTETTEDPPGSSDSGSE